ncbi:MAG: methionyl-tRNA formyltransferase [Clostridia bacterium]|jgi:methionyl-tRNA formyltransferase|nr:methionyl-tRNA formyltransferase [Clostridia bacterium]
MRIVFLGTPNFAVNVLKALFLSHHEIVGVITMPDKKGKRGNKTISSPVKEFSEKEGLKTFQFENINTQIKAIEELKADIGVTAAYGQILKEGVINVFKYGIINVHASILPKYRGASPVQCALLNGEKEIGVTIMKTVLAVDAGDILNIKRVVLNGQEKADECLEILSNLGGIATIETLDAIESDLIKPVEQDHTKASFCKKINKEDGKIDFTKESAEDILNKIRAFSPWPSVYFQSKYGQMKIVDATVKAEDTSKESLPGTIIGITNKGLWVKCKNGALEINRVQLEGGKVLEIREFLLGRPFQIKEEILAKG